MHYGRVVTFNSEAEKLALDGKLLVADAIHPHSWVLTESDVHDIAPDDWGEYQTFVHRMYDSAVRLSNSLDGCQPGKLFRFNVCDGYAYYVVTKVGKRIVHLEWRGFSMDGYTDSVLDYEGIITRERCEQLIEQQDPLNKMMSGLFGE
jgi:hypothetical protein